jgi:hypothetical protein
MAETVSQNRSQVCIIQKVTSLIHLIDPNTCQGKLSSERRRNEKINEN